jgi:hypothetical protein
MYCQRRLLKFILNYRLKEGDLGRRITVEENWNILTISLEDIRKSTVFVRFEVLSGVMMKLLACGM